MAIHVGSPMNQSLIPGKIKNAFRHIQVSINKYERSDIISNLQ